MTGFSHIRGNVMLRIFGTLSTGQKLLGMTVALAMGSVLGAGVYAYFPTATNQGYMPTQPIPFSHKIHAGDNKIDCKYCHVAAEKSRHASVPAMNICMNCHMVVKTDSPYIQKLHEYYNAGKPIEWVRIHELPDHVFFNHQRHVKKGVSCETCHGDVKSMDVVYQSEKLTMGWCIECHRGRSTPRKVISDISGDGDNSRTAVAPDNCNTCHY